MLAYQLVHLHGELAGVDLESASTDRLASWVVAVVAAEGPVHVGEVVRRLADAAGVKRLGGRIQSAIESACDTRPVRGTIAPPG